MKPYTPVDRTLMPRSQASTERELANVFLMIKVYPDGALTPHLDALNIGETRSSLLLCVSMAAALREKTSPGNVGE